MFKRITSNRDPNDTVFNELKKEFAIYFEKAGSTIRSVIVRYPKFLFGLMVTSLSLSALFEFALFRNAPPPDKKMIVSGKTDIGSGFSQIIDLSRALNETVRLKKEVYSLTAKKILTPADSILLERDFDSLRLINQQIKPQKNGH